MTTDALPGLSLEVVPPPPEQDVLRTDVATVLGRTRRGPVGVPVRVQSRLEYESWFGPVDGSSATPLAVRGFFENNGRTVWVLRVAGASGTASMVWAPGDPLPGGLGFRQYRVLATSPGAWANGTRVRIRYQASSLAGPPAIMVRVAAPGEPAETFPAMPPGQLVDRLAGSRLIRLLPVGDPAPTEPPAARRCGSGTCCWGPRRARRPATRRPPRVPTARRAPPTTGSLRRPRPNCRNRRCLPRRT